MNENASHKEGGEEEIPKTPSDSPGIPAGEELSLDPVSGDEIDPIDRWWDDSDSEEREKIRNRRIEEGEVHRVKTTPPITTESSEEEEIELPPPVTKEELFSKGEDTRSDEVALDDKNEATTETHEYGGLEDIVEPSKSRETQDPPENILPEETEKDSLEMPTFSVSPLKRVHRTGPMALDTMVDSSAPEDADTTAEVGDPEKKGIPDEIDEIEKAPEKEKVDESKAFEGLDGLLGGQEESTLPVTVTPPKKKAGCWTIFATLFFIGSVLLFLGIAALAVFAWSRMGDFEKEVTALVSGKLEEREIYLEFGTSTYEFPRGLVFDEVTVFDDPSKERPAIIASGVGVNVDVAGLVTGGWKLGSAEISLKESKLTLFEGTDIFAEVSGIDGEILAGEEVVEVERLSARVGGLIVDLKGRVNLSGTDAAAEEPDAEGGVPVAEPAPDRLGLDFAAFRQIQSWLAIEGTGGEAPVLTANFVMDAARPDLFELSGNLSGSELRWNKIDFKSALVAFAIVPETGVLSFPSVQLGYGEGIIAATLSVDPSANILRIGQFQSTVDIVSLLKSYQPEYAEKLKAVRFVDAPTIQITGEIPLADATQADLEIRYEHGQGLVYLNGERELPLKDIRGTFKLSRGSLETNDAAADLFGGTVLLSGATRLTSDASPFNGLIEISRMPLDKAAVYFGQESVGMSGLLFLTFRGVGYKDVSKIRGGGTLRIDEASLPAFPVLGPVQKLVGGIVPAFGAPEKGSVTGAYIIESGVLLTNDLTVENGGAKIVTGGSLNLSSKETQFSSRALLEPSLAAATGLADKSITVDGSGPVTAPVLKISTFPIEFASESLGTVLGTSKESLGTLKDALADSENPAGVISGKIEEATGIKIDPEITELFNSFLGGGEASAAPAPAPLRAQPN